MTNNRALLKIAFFAKTSEIALDKAVRQNGRGRSDATARTCFASPTKYGAIHAVCSGNEFLEAPYKYKTADLVRSFLLSLLMLFYSTVGYAAGLFEDKGKIYVKAILPANEAIGKKIGRFKFIDQDGNRFDINDFAGKPFILSFIYTACPDVCPNLLAAVAQVVQESGDRFGRDFRVLTVSFDVENDQPGVLKSYGESFTDDFTNWKFVTAKSRIDIRNFTARLGFKYKKTRDGYDHLSMTTVIGADGVIKAHFFGDAYTPEMIFEAIDMKGPRKLDLDALSVVGRLLIYCSYYDPATGEYRVDYVLIGQFMLQYVLAIGTIIFLTRKGLSRFFKKLFCRI